MAAAKATVESWVDTPCAGWAEGGGIWDVENSLNCEASGLQLWLVFLLLMTANCVQCRFFGVLRNFLISVFAEITIACLLQILYWLLKLDTARKWLCDGIILFLIALNYFGTYEKSLFVGRYEAIFETRNPAFGGRGPGILSRTKRSKARHSYEFDSTKGFHGEGWSATFPLLKIATWNCRSLTFERVQYCRALAYDVLALTASQDPKQPADDPILQTLFFVCTDNMDRLWKKVCRIIVCRV